MSPPSIRADVDTRLRREGLQPSAWGNGPGDTYGAHRHTYDKVLVTVAGAITFHLPELAGEVVLAEGERLELPAGTLHAAKVGAAGVTCLEAHLPAGTLAGPPRHRATDW